jgi:hypothetical protein
MDPTRLPQAAYGPRFGDRVRQEPSIKRRTFMALVSGGLLAAPLATEARQSGNVYRLGVLTPGVRPSSPVTTANLLPVILREMGSGSRSTVKYPCSQIH